MNATTSKKTTIRARIREAIEVATNAGKLRATWKTPKRYVVAFKENGAITATSIHATRERAWKEAKRQIRANVAKNRQTPGADLPTWCFIAFTSTEHRQIYVDVVLNEDDRPDKLSDILGPYKE